MKNILLIIFVFILVNNSIAQDIKQNNQKPDLKLIHKVTDAGIKLRWAPTSKEAWWQLKDDSYNIYRATYEKNLPNSKDYKLIKAEHRILPESIFSAQMDDPNISDFYKIIGGSYYGEWETIKPGTNSLDNWGHRLEELESRYLAVVYACDMNFAAAESAGLGYMDMDVEKGKNYVYKIELANDSIYSSLYKVVLQSQQKVDDKIVISGVEKEDQIVIQWPREANSKYTAFHIEESKDGISYNRITELPYINTLTKDVNKLPLISYLYSVTNYDPYYYRVIGLDAFGDESQPSDPLKLQGRDRTPPILPLFDSAYLHIDQTAFILKWHFMEKSLDLDKIIIKKGPQFEGPFYPLAELSAPVINYRDNNPSMSQLQYYKVCVVDTAGNEGCSPAKYAFINDRISPDAPTGLTGYIDSSGIVTLHWHLGQEEDLLGYFVHQANGRGRVFANKTHVAVRDTVWRDTITLHTLTEEVFYRVNAVDLRKNYSKFSKLIRLTKPDTIPPRPSVFKSYKVNKDHVSIDYALSSSFDISKILLIRKTIGNNEIKEILITSPSSNYKDYEIKPNEKYAYNLITIDDANHQTEAPKQLVVRTKDNKIHHKVALTLTIEEDQANFLWEEPLATYNYIKMYTGKTEKTMTTYKHIKDINSFKISKARLKNKFVKIKIFYKGGAISDFSNTVQVI